MVQSPTIVNCSLTKDRDRKLFLKSIGKESLNFPGVGKVPTSGAREARERSGAYQALLGEAKVLRDFIVGCGLDEHAGNLRIGAAHLAASLRHLLFFEVECMLGLVDLSLRD